MYGEMRRKDGFYTQLFIDLVPADMDSSTFRYFNLATRDRPYGNHMVPERQESAAHEIQNYWISHIFREKY